MADRYGEAEDEETGQYTQPDAALLAEAVMAYVLGKGFKGDLKTRLINKAKSLASIPEWKRGYYALDGEVLAYDPSGKHQRSNGNKARTQAPMVRFSITDETLFLRFENSGKYITCGNSTTPHAFKIVYEAAQRILKAHQSPVARTTGERFSRRIVGKSNTTRPSLA